MKNLVRAFIAIDIENKEVTSKLLEIQRLLKRTGASMKLVEPENIHLTLYFLGEISEASINLIGSIIKQCIKNKDPFEMHLFGVGAFPKITRPRVIWVGIKEGSQELIEIASCLKKKLIANGFRRETKDFHPHVTLARVKYYNSALIQVLNKITDSDFGSINVSTIKLKKSTLTSKGPIYEDLLKIPLGSSSET